MALIFVTKEQDRFVKEDFDRYDKIYAMADDVIDDIRRIAKDKYDPSKVDLFMNELVSWKKSFCS